MKKKPALLLILLVIVACASFLLNSCCQQCPHGNNIISATILQYAPGGGAGSNVPAKFVQVLIHSARWKNGQSVVCKMSYSSDKGEVNFKELPDGTYYIMAMVSQRNYVSKAVVSGGNVVSTKVYVPILNYKSGSMHPDSSASATVTPDQASGAPSMSGNKGDISSIKVGSGGMLPITVLITTPSDPLDTRYMVFSDYNQEYAANYLSNDGVLIEATDAFESKDNRTCSGNPSNSCGSVLLFPSPPTKKP